MSADKLILCTGLVCIDVIQTCEQFPIEDSDQRCIDYHLQRGGNASNNCTVLRKLGSNCEFFGTISRSSSFTRFIIEDYKKHNIAFNNIVYHDDCEVPLSTIIINNQNGSRTIIHANKNLPELKFDDFRKLDLLNYSWIHFEGRNVLETIKMLEYVKKWKSNTRNSLTVSVEVEKPKSDMINLIHFADVVFISKDFATFNGYKNMKETVHGFSQKIKTRPILICAWGEDGAIGLTSDGVTVKSKAFPPPKVVDTLGAGDTFVASVIFSLNNGRNLEQSLANGCKIAGRKVGLKGFDSLENFIKDI